MDCLGLQRCHSPPEKVELDFFGVPFLEQPRKVIVEKLYKTGSYLGAKRWTTETISSHFGSLRVTLPSYRNNMFLTTV